MKQLFSILSIAILLSSCSSITGSGHIVTDKRQAGSFTGITSSGGIEVEITQGSSPSISVEADDNLISHIETRVEGSVLKISLKGIHNVRNAHMKVYVTAPVINMLHASSGSSMEVKNVLTSGGKLSLNASSAGSIHAHLDAPEVEANASSAGSLTLKGKTKTYSATSSSGASIKSPDLLSENTEASASSGGNAHVHASVNLFAHASSGGSVVYNGAGAVHSSVSSGGDVKMGN